MTRRNPDAIKVSPRLSGPANIRTLSEDCRNVRLTIPPVNLAGLAEPLKLFLDFDAGAVDQMIDRLTVLPSRMLLGLTGAGNDFTRLYARSDLRARAACASRNASVLKAGLLPVRIHVGSHP